MQSSKITRSGNLIQLDTGDKVTAFPFSGDNFDSAVADFYRETQLSGVFDALLEKEWQMECEAVVDLLKGHLPDRSTDITDINATGFLFSLHENLKKNEVGSIYLMGSQDDEDGSVLINFALNEELREKFLSIEPAIDESDTEEDRISRHIVSTLSKTPPPSADPASERKPSRKKLTPEQRIARLEQKIARVKALQKQNNRKLQTRAKIILGNAFLRHVDSLAADQQQKAVQSLWALISEGGQQVIVDSGLLPEQAIPGDPTVQAMDDVIKVNVALNEELREKLLAIEPAIDESDTEEDRISRYLLSILNK